MRILILGNSQDIHAAQIHRALTETGCQVHYLDSALFPQKLSLSWQPDNQQGELIFANGERVNLAEIHSVFWRTFSGVKIPSLNETYQQNLALNDSMSALRTLMQGTKIRWINSWQAYQFHKEKPLQLSKVKQSGVKIPDTLITNNPDAVIQFSQRHNQAIFKPVYGGAHTKLIRQEELDLERISLALRISPITLQEYISGTNIRSYVIGKSVYSAEIRSPSLDFRDDRQAQLIPVKIPDTIEKQCLKIAQALWLEWTAIDWRLTPEGEYVFLEANPSPMFIHFENQTNYPITDKLVQLLQE